MFSSPNPFNFPPLHFRKRLFSFTLIELLMVIFITALLLCLLVPALGLSLQSSLSAVCLSNQKQLNYAFQSYSQENDNYFPLGLSTQPLLEHGGTNWVRYMLPYTGSLKIFDCPASPDPAPGRSPEAMHFYDGNYGWNFDGTQGKYGPWSRRIASPSQGYLLFDSGDQCITYWSNKWESLMEELDLNWDSGKEGCNRHRGNVNVSFLDCHGSGRSLHDFLAVPNTSRFPPWHINWTTPVLMPGKIPYPGR